MTNLAKKIFPIIVVLAIFALAVFSIILNIRKAREEQRALNDQVKEILVEEQEVTEEEIKLDDLEKEEEVNVKGWKTYNNEALGFEFDYPEDKLILFSDQKKVQLHGDCDLTENQDSVYGEGCEDQSILSFEVIDYDLEVFLEEKEQQCEDQSECVSFNPFAEQFLLDGYTGAKVEAVSVKGDDVVKDSEYLFITKENMTYIISYNNINSIYQRIISTFKFTD